MTLRCFRFVESVGSLCLSVICLMLPIRLFILGGLVLFQINQLEKDRDVIGQVQAVTALRAHSRTSFALVNALSNCLNDPKVHL